MAKQQKETGPLGTYNVIYRLEKQHLTATFMAPMDATVQGLASIMYCIFLHTLSIVQHSKRSFAFLFIQIKDALVDARATK